MMEMPLAQVKKYPNCFGCGSSNPIGYRLNLRLEGDRLVTEFVPGEDHQGWPGIAHGGVITTLLYEVLENLPFHQGVTAMMKSMDTNLRRPAETGRRLIAESWLVDRSGRNMNVSASLTGEDGKLIAEGNAVLVVLTEQQKARLGLP